MDEAFETIVRRLQSEPPSCVRGLRASPSAFPVDRSRIKTACVEWEIAVKSVWRLACPCGEGRGRVLGHPLLDPDPDDDRPTFLGPLAFECPACESVAEILDTDVHGYHAELARIEPGAGSVKPRGEGPRRPFPCPVCGADRFIVTVGFIYWPGSFDLFFDSPDLPIREFFLEFLCHGECVSCGEVSAITDLGKL